MPKFDPIAVLDRLSIAVSQLSKPAVIPTQPQNYSFAHLSLSRRREVLASKPQHRQRYAAFVQEQIRYLQQHWE